MSLKTNTKGFTIVELLIVIVVIGILAAITIVAFNGIQNRARTSSAKSAAQTVLKKAEAYNADESTAGYPILPSQLASAAGTTTYALSGAASFATGTGGTSPNFTTAPTTVPSDSNVLIFYSCGINGGLRVDYWDYSSTSTNKWTPLATGGCATTGGTFKSSGATS